MFQVGGSKRYISRTVPGLFDVLSEVGGLFQSIRYVLSFLSIILVVPMDTLDFFFAMQEMDDYETDPIDQDSKFRQYFEIQLFRWFGFNFEFTDRLQRYQNISEDLLSFEYRLMKHGTMKEWHEKDQER